MTDLTENPISENSSEKNAMDIWTFGHLDIWKKNMINWCGREIYGKLYKKVN
jgi:hypothetical protein